MRHGVMNLLEMGLGALILGLGLLCLVSQERMADRLINVAADRILREEDIYQQYHAPGIKQVSEEELHAVLMGYREHPIRIDGSIIPPDGTDYTDYFLLIKDGLYNKEYIYNTEHEIVQVIYTYAGVS